MNEGIILNPDNIEYNPGKRSLTKLMLNSMWGKFGHRVDKAQHREFTKSKEFHQFLSKDSYDITYVSPLTEERVEVHYKNKDGLLDPAPNLNFFVACFTTYYARLRLYEALHLL